MVDIEREIRSMMTMVVMNTKRENWKPTRANRCGFGELCTLLKSRPMRGG